MSISSAQPFVAEGAFIDKHADSSMTGQPHDIRGPGRFFKRHETVLIVASIALAILILGICLLSGVGAFAHASNSLRQILGSIATVAGGGTVTYCFCNILLESQSTK